VKLTRGERFEEARRNANLTMDEASNEKTGAGVSKSLIQALEDDDNSRDVGYLKVAKLAACYKVSADYLLGLSDIASPDITIQEIGKKTGLSEKAIKRLQQFNNNDIESNQSLFNTMHDFKTMDLLNSFLEHQKLNEFIANIYAAMRYSKFQLADNVIGEDGINAEKAASRIGGIVLQQEDAIGYFQQEAINVLRDIVYDLIPDKKKEE